MRQVYLNEIGRIHSLHEGLIKYPPEGYHIVVNEAGWNKLFSDIARLDRSIFPLLDRVLGQLIPVNLAMSYIERFKKPPKGTDLTYSTGRLEFRKEPWIVALEFVTEPISFRIKHFYRYRGLIKRTLASEHCKKIISYTEAGINTVLQNLDCPEIAEKVAVIRPAIEKKHFTKDYNHSSPQKIKLLFVGSSNLLGEFEYKGGKEVLEAFISLRRRYSNLELVVRSDIPKKIKAKYVGVNNLTIIDSILPWEQLEQEFKSADVFLFPTYATPASVILDAMSYELPVITTDVWGNPEFIDDGKTGFLVKKSEKPQYYVENFIPIWTAKSGTPFMKSIESVDFKVVDELVKKTSILIENKELRERVGKTAREEVENGEFSLDNRNEQLKRIFDDATGNS